MTRHVSTDQLALLAVGELRRRKAARFEAHIAGCTLCTQVHQQLTQVSVTLASVRYPPMPDSFSARIEVALASESAQRVAAAPATEAGRRDLPTRRRSGTAEWRGWRLPGMSVATTRLVTAAAALAIIAGGSYTLATNVGGTSSGVSSSAGAPAALPAPARQLALGPDVTYGRPGSTHTIHAVRAGTDFVPAQLTSQAIAAVHAARLRGASAAGAPSVSAPPVSAPSAANRSSVSSGAAGSAAPGSGTSARLAGCIDLIAPGRTVLLVELAKYEGRPATIIVTAASGATQAAAWVVGDSCSATSSDVLAHVQLGRL